MVNVESAKNLATKLLKPLALKYIVRFITWGTTTALVTKLFGELEAGTATSLGEWLATGAMTGVTMLIDYISHKYGKNNETALTAVVAGIEQAKVDDPRSAKVVTAAIGVAAKDAGTVDITRAAVDAAKTACGGKR